MKRFLISTFIITLAISMSAVFAAGVEVSLSKNSLVGYTSETQTVDVIVKNIQSKADTFTLSVFPAQLEKVTASLDNFIITLNPNEEKYVKLFLSVPIDSDLISPQFTITVKSTSDSSVSDSEQIALLVQRKSPVYIPSLILDKYAPVPGESVQIVAKIFNLDEAKSGKNLLKITVSKGSTIVKVFEDSLDAIGSKSYVNITKTLILDNYAAPGSYVINAELRDISGELKYAKSTNFNVNATTKSPTEYIEKSNSFNPVFLSTAIKVKNGGNIDLQPFSVSESIPKFIQNLFDPDIEPISTEISGSRVVYTWNIPLLSPGEQLTIKYKIDIWRIWLALGLIAIVAYAGYRWLSKPRLGKRIHHQGEISKGKEIIVMLEVKNRALHEIKDVEVVDLIPAIARVVDKFDTLRPRARRVARGTELRWFFGSLKAGEERIVTYRIRPAVDIVGHLNLPEAQMVFLDRNRVRRMSASKQAMVKAQPE